MRFHQALRAEANREAGMTSLAAATASRRAFGMSGRLKRRVTTRGAHDGSMRFDRMCAMP